MIECISRKHDTIKAKCKQQAPLEKIKFTGGELLNTKNHRNKNQQIFVRLLHILELRRTSTYRFYRKYS